MKQLIIAMASTIYRLLKTRVDSPSRAPSVSRLAIDQWENEGGALEAERPKRRSDGWGSESAMSNVVSFEE